MRAIFPNYPETRCASPPSPPPDFTSECRRERLSGAALEAFLNTIQDYTRMVEDVPQLEGAEAFEALMPRCADIAPQAKPRAGA
jgi:hypothetical protein